MDGMTTATSIHRERARHDNGQFGEQQRTQPEMTLSARAKIERARELAEDILAEHGLEGWRVSFDNTSRRLGVCRHRSKTISLSRQYIAVGEDATTLDTIRHEVAHALAGPGEGHGPVWRDIAARLGADPTATTDVPEMKDAKSRRLEDLIRSRPFPRGYRIPDGTEVIIREGQSYLRGMRATILSRATTRYHVETEDGQQFRARAEFFGSTPDSP